MLDDKAPLSDDDIDDILDALGSFGGTVTQAISKPIGHSERAYDHCTRETRGGCTVLRPAAWRR
jgi:hypothetical protein